MSQSTPPPQDRHGDQPLDGRSLADARRAAIRSRARRIRRAVAAVALALFTAAFLAVYVQLASGHDPALSRHTSTSAAGSGTAQSSSGESSSEGSGSEAAGGESGATGETSSTPSSEASESPSGVTTSQS
jgi:hypothetical protein